MLGHYTLTYSLDCIFIFHWLGNLGTLFYTTLGCKKFYRIGPSIAMRNQFFISDMGSLPYFAFYQKEDLEYHRFEALYVFI